MKKVITKAEFEKLIDKVREFNCYTPEQVTVTECDKVDRWTPCDLVCREYYNNGCGSAEGFLGITPKECEECFNYIREHLEEIKSKDYLSKDGYSNCGFDLWTDWNLH